MEKVKFPVRMCVSSYIVVVGDFYFFVDQVNNRIHEKCALLVVEIATKGIPLSLFMNHLAMHAYAF